MENELKLGLRVIGENEFTRRDGVIDDMHMSIGERKEMIYRVCGDYFFADEITPVEFSNSPENYYDMMTNLKKDLIASIRRYGVTIDDGSMYYDFGKHNALPRIAFGNENVSIKKISVTNNDDTITITTDDGEQLPATYNYNAQLWSYWHIYDNVYIESKKKRKK